LQKFKSLEDLLPRSFLNFMLEIYVHFNNEKGWEGMDGEILPPLEKVGGGMDGSPSSALVKQNLEFQINKFPPVYV
jgi:hypothetical protein